MWAGILLAAEKWGVPPWEVTGETIDTRGRITWLQRWLMLEEQRAKANNG